VNKGLDVRIRFHVDDQVLSELHGRAFDQDGATVQPWARRLEQHSLTWVGAFVADDLVGFVHACWDGGVHAFLLDTVVDPNHQRRGVGRLLVRTLIVEVTAAGCHWLHVDYEQHLDDFYRDVCGFRAAAAGLLDLTNQAAADRQLH
jgi:GNAT superfamily N-acetyltransferase